MAIGRRDGAYQRAGLAQRSFEESHGFSELDRGLPEEGREGGCCCGGGGSSKSSVFVKISDRAGRCWSVLWRLGGGGA